ncbi:uncharacterized protein zgc:193726 [Polyodon spathula]|uniref:uncharacterized protein zgc:193726 n=1 Tax=Polyodon spathula TaxID=7913 RepID=UPI001B7F6404|nr:uncharacterized protein zgc:193726 [Polyodon spathula]
MNAVLSFSLFLFSCALVFPRPFDTIQENIPTKGDNEVYLEINKTEGNVTIGFGSYCLLPTCALDNLAHILQTGSGDESAGSSVHDPYGNGKRK